MCMVCSFLFFPPEKELMQWRSGLVHCICENRICNKLLKAINTEGGLRKHFTGIFSEMKFVLIKPSKKGFNRSLAMHKTSVVLCPRVSLSLCVVVPFHHTRF